MNSSATSQFFIAYDYGMGGAWGIVRADSEENIKRVFPELQVYKEAPSWMDDDIRRRMEAQCFDLDDPLTYPDWIIALIEQR